MKESKKDKLIFVKTFLAPLNMIYTNRKKEVLSPHDSCLYVNCDKKLLNNKIPGQSVSNRLELYEFPV